MNVRTTLLLLIAFVVLGGYVLWSERGKPVDATTGDTSSTPVLQINSSDVSAMVVRNSTGKQVRVERSGGDWQLREPAAGRTDAASVTNVLNGLSRLSATRTITPTTQDLGSYGLAAPAYTIQLFKGSATLAELRLGSKNPDRSATYVQHVGSPIIYLVSDSILDTIEQWPGAPPVQPTPTVPPPTTRPPARFASPNATATATAK
jgi:hypothetical protein